MPLSLFQQQIYNTWLRVIRTRAKKPFRPRTKWDDLNPSYVLYLNQLAAFFGKHQHIDVECFFDAPYEVYVHDVNASYTLQFYTTHKAISLYTSYLRLLKLLNPDHPLSIKWINQSFVYIGRYCINNNMTLSNYGSQTPGCFVAPFLRHIKDGHITIYAMFAFPSAVAAIQALDVDVRQLMLSDIDVHQFLRDYMQSKKAKPVAELAYRTLDEYLKKKQATKQN